MRGVVITGLSGDVTASLAQALKGYRQQAVPQGLPTPLDMHWKITWPTARLMTITRPITDTTYVWTAPNQAGEFKIAAMVGSQPHGESELSVTSRCHATGSVTATAGLTATATTTNDGGC